MQVKQLCILIYILYQEEKVTWVDLKTVTHMTRLVESETSFRGRVSINADIAQLVEHLVYTEAVGGSSPSVRTMGE